MSARPLPTRHQARLICLFAAVTTVVCASLLAAAALVPAPAAVLPLIILVCIGCPMAAAYELPPAMAALRGERAWSALRRQLDDLPETPHPLGL